MRVVIVDDEPLARRGVVLRLQRFDDVEIVGECGDGASAVEIISQQAPDVIFLDVQMPGMSGFDVLRELNHERLPLVIFLTAYEQHAVAAFDVEAIDYLMKPIRDDRFEEALARARSRLHAEAATSSHYRSHISVRTGERIQIVAVKDIVWIAAAGDYVELHCAQVTRLLRRSLNVLERELDPREFIRIHRSRIVRSESIRELRPLENREYVVKLADGSEHRSSRTYADCLRAWLVPEVAAH